MAAERKSQELPQYKYVTQPEYGGFDFHIGKKNEQIVGGYFTLKGFLPQLRENAPNYFSEAEVDQIAKLALITHIAPEEDMRDERNRRTFYYVWLALNGLFESVRKTVDLTHADLLLMFKYSRVFNLPSVNFPSMLVSIPRTYQVGGKIEVEYVPQLDEHYLIVVQNALAMKDEPVIKAALTYMYWLDERAEQSKYPSLVKGQPVPWVYVTAPKDDSAVGVVDSVTHPLIFTDQENKLLLALGKMLVGKYPDIADVIRDATLREQQWKYQVEQLRK